VELYCRSHNKASLADVVCLNFNHTFLLVAKFDLLTPNRFSKDIFLLNIVMSHITKLKLVS